MRFLWLNDELLSAGTVIVLCRHKTCMDKVTLCSHRAKNQKSPSLFYRIMVILVKDR